MNWWTPRNWHDPIPRAPWLHVDVIAELEGIVTADMTVIEFGCGGSTLWFADRAAHVISVEHNAKWYDAVKALAPDNVTMILDDGVPLVPDCDLLFVDCVDKQTRRAVIANALDIVRPGGYIVIDNANRPEYAAEVAAMAKRCELITHHDNNEEFSRFFVTDIYRVPAPPRRRRKKSDTV